MHKEILENIINELDKMQSDISKLRNQVIDKLKELDDSAVYLDEEAKITQETLDYAKQISFRELDLEVRFDARISNGIERHEEIKTFEDLYYSILEDPNCKKIRNIGDKSAREVRQVISNMPNIVERIKRRRKNIEECNQNLKFFFDNEVAKELMAEYRVNNLKDLYELYVQNRNISLRNGEKTVRELLQRY